jgi:1-acyl-sn-glycerol-3-phosphate acyltransferase
MGPRASARDDALGIGLEQLLGGFNTSNPSNSITKNASKTPAMAPNPLADLGAGLSTVSPPIHPSGPVKVGPTGQVERAFSAASTFLAGAMAISATQFLGAPLKMLDPEFYNAYMAFTKQSFGVLLTSMTQWWSPTVVRVSGDTSIPKQLAKRADGNLECKFPSRLIMMANHQLYTDWLYLWWVSYTNNMHGYIYIIMKESLKNIPIFGWGAQFYNFIFLKRDWEADKQNFKKHLSQLDDPKQPMWLLIFPEGTNLAKSTKEKSKEWAKKNGLTDMKHQLLPRSKGLQFCLQNLKNSTEWLYDCTIGYEGIPPGQFGQDIFTLRSSMFEGRPPKSVNMHFRRFKISEIPIDNDKAFEVWLRNRWREKDYLLEHFVRHNRFPEEPNWMLKQKQAKTKGAMPAKFIETQIKSNNLEEFLSIFAPLSSVLMVLFMFYGGGNPNDMIKMIGEAAAKNEKVALVRDLTSKDNPLKLEKTAKGQSMPSFNAIKGAGETAAQAQRNLLQKYVAAVKPSAQREIDLPNRALKASNAGNKPFANPVKGAFKGVAAKSTPRPGVGSRRPSVATVATLPSISSVQSSRPIKKSTTAPSVASSVSTAPSRGPKIAPSGIPTVEAKSAQTQLATRETAAKKLALARKVNDVKAQDEKKKDVPTFRMDQATYERMRAANKPGAAGTKKTPVQKTPKTGQVPAAVGSKVNVDPEVLKRMKAAQKGKR